jgi:hypothetical protein
MEQAWAAGLFDGEGSTNIENANSKRRLPSGRPRDYPNLRVNVGQDKDPEVLHRFQAAVDGIGNIYYAKGYDKYNWMARGDDALRVLEILWPYLSGPKKAQALRIGELYNKSQEIPRKYNGAKRRRMELT